MQVLHPIPLVRPMLKRMAPALARVARLVQMFAVQVHHQNLFPLRSPQLHLTQEFATQYQQAPLLAHPLDLPGPVRHLILFLQSLPPIDQLQFALQRFPHLLRFLRSHRQLLIHQRSFPILPDQPVDLLN